MFDTENHASRRGGKISGLQSAFTPAVKERFRVARATKQLNGVSLKKVTVPKPLYHVTCGRRARYKLLHVLNHQQHNHGVDRHARR